MFKGKKTRDESQLKIVDETIAPYCIYFDGLQYTVVEEVETKQNNIGYYSNFKGALASIAKLLVLEQKTSTIADFINAYDEVMGKLETLFENHKSL